MFCCLAQLVLAIVILTLLRNYNEEAENPITILKSLDGSYVPLADWDVIPYVSLTIVDGDAECPEDHPSVVVYHKFPGTKRYCDCKYGYYAGLYPDCDMSEKNRNW